MNFIKTIRYKNLIFFAYLCITTLVVRPWRFGFAQDDGVYASLSLMLSKGEFSQHPVLLAAAWPQAFIGAALLKMLPYSAAMIAMNAATWSTLLVLMVVLRFTWKLPILLCLYIFIYPPMIQHGASFLSEIYAMLLLALCLTFFQRVKTRGRADLYSAALLGLLIVLLGLQRQTLIAYPFCWGVFELCWAIKKSENFRSRRTIHVGVLAVLSTVLALFVYAIFPKSPIQLNFFAWGFELLKEKGILLSCFQVFARLWESVIVAGLIFIPFVSSKWFNIRRCVFLFLAQISFILVMVLSKTIPLSSGVIFTSYFPPILTILLWSFGTWGLAILPFIHKAVSEEERAIWYGSGLATIIIGLFYAVIRETVMGDLRYSLPTLLPVAFVGRHYWNLRDTENSFISSKPLIGGLVLLTLGSWFVNGYNLDTMEARWQAARQLESSNVSKDEISAGYGRDVFELCLNCVRKALKKVEDNPVASVRKSEFLEHILKQSPKLYADGWASRYVIKPYSILGHRLKLTQNVRPGQDGMPIAVSDYWTFGLHSQLAVFQSSYTHPAWCDETLGNSTR